MNRLIIAGTFVPPWVANVVYQPLSRALDARITYLEFLGLVPVRNQVERIARMLRRTGPADLIGHSQGGLVAALVASKHPDLVNRTVTIGAPLKGTPLAPGGFPGAVGDMAPGAPILDWLHMYFGMGMLNIVGTKDSLVPVDSAVRPYAEVSYFDLGHVELVNSPLVNEVIQEWLAKPTPDWYHPLDGRKRVA